MLKNLFTLNQRSLFSIHDPVGVTMLTRLRLQFSLLNEHKFRHNFKDCVSPMCDCGAETETTSHFFLRCQFFGNERQKLDASIKHLNEEFLIDVLLYSSDRFNDSKNKQILLHTICYIQATKSFERPLIDQCIYYRCVFLLYVCLSFISNATCYPIILISSLILAIRKVVLEISAIMCSTLP